jgi:hypothetical protein
MLYLSEHLLSRPSFFLGLNTVTHGVKSSKMPENLRDYVARGRTESTPLGTTIFCGLRALDPLLQRSLLLSAPLASLPRYFGRSAASPPPAGGDVIRTAGLDLTPFQAVIWGMSVGSAVKQIFWLLAICNEVSEGNESRPLPMCLMQTEHAGYKAQ